MGRTKRNQKSSSAVSRGRLKIEKASTSSSYSIINMFKKQRQQQTISLEEEKTSTSGACSQEDSDIEIIENQESSTKTDHQIKTYQMEQKNPDMSSGHPSSKLRKRKLNIAASSPEEIFHKSIQGRNTSKNNSVSNNDIPKGEISETDESKLMVRKKGSILISNQQIHRHEHETQTEKDYEKLMEPKSRLSLRKKKSNNSKSTEKEHSSEVKIRRKSEDPVKEPTTIIMSPSECTMQSPAPDSATSGKYALEISDIDSNTMVKDQNQNEPLHNFEIKKIDKDEEEKHESQMEQMETGSDKLEDEEVQYRVPYYLENFMLILDSVIEDPHYWKLFNEEDRNIIKTFQDLSECGQKLYVRLFQRKVRWLRDSQIEYKNIADDLTPVLRELVDRTLLLDDTSLTDLEDILSTLPAPDLKVLAKSLRLSATDQRTAIIEAVLQHAKKKSISSFFSAGHSKDNQQEVVKRARGLLGHCYKIDTASRWVLMRAMMLFSLHNITGEEDETGNSLQLFQMLMINIGQVKYPKYMVDRQTEIFTDRQALLEYCSAVQLEADIRESVETNSIDRALELYEQVKHLAMTANKDRQQTEHATSLPEHLRRYTAGSVYVRILSQGVEALQKARKYEVAVVQLEQLISQTVYHVDYRGCWYERLALNVHSHLKQPQRALDIIQKGLMDDRVRTGHRYALWQRAQKICSTPSLAKLHSQWDKFNIDIMAGVQEAPKVTIEGRQLVVPGVGTQWCSDDSHLGEGGQVTFIKRVEDVALRHYTDFGYPQGIHDEGGTVRFMLGLLLWDDLFIDMPDAFISPHQAAPLDLRTDHFYVTRQERLDESLDRISRSTELELGDWLEKSWTEHEGTYCVGVNWERFESIEHAKGLLKCIGGPVLAEVIKRMVKNMRYTCSGFPDLIVWNTETSKFKVVEVKGPGDRLSTKQILWLDYLLSLGVDAEVCHVVAVGTKKLRAL